jgi:CheY-like chemotaxis protein
VPHDDAHILPMAPGPLVLVVDDEAGPRTVITHTLHGLGYPTRSCASGRAALQFLGAHPREVRLLMADLGMPGMDGGELAERARDLDRSLTVVLMADPGDAGARELLDGYRDLPLLWKPDTPGELVRTIEDLLGAPGRTPGYPPSLAPAWPRRRRRSSDRHHEV